MALAKCQRCGGGMLREDSELVCFACGRDTYALTPEIEAMLREEQRGHGRGARVAQSELYRRGADADR